MTALRLATWNVLHRVHAETFDEGVVAPHPDEAARAASIAALAAEVMAGGVAVLCLQEVSGDQRDALRRALPAGGGLFELAYPRRPQPRRPHVGRLRDATELLVTVVAPGLPASSFNPWLTLVYVVFVPLQELIYRGGVQGALEHFIAGPHRRWQAIVGSNIIFSAAHLYISPGLSVTAFVAGLFWGWLYSRQRALAGVSLSHLLLGFFAFEVVDLGVLE